jgi:acyl dehydratase
VEVPVYFEDLVVGASFLSDEVAIDRDEMLAYHRRNDPWPFHVDEDRRRRILTAA